MMMATNLTLGLLVVVFIAGTWGQSFPWMQPQTGGNNIAWPKPNCAWGTPGCEPAMPIRPPLGKQRFPPAQTRPPRPNQPLRPTQPPRTTQPPRPTRPSPTTTTPTTTTAVSDCQFNCQSTQEFNPVCGSDGINYRNPGLLRCAQRCGKDVRMVYNGTCRRSG